MDSQARIPAALSLDAFDSLEARAAFDLAAGSGYRGITFATNHPELNPANLGLSARKHLKTILSGRQLAIESLRAAAPRGGLSDPATIDRTLDNARKALLLARELGIGTVALNVGALGAGADAKAAEGMVVSALRELAQQADAAGVSLAIGADRAESLASLLKQVDFDGARANLDGARLIGAGEDALKAAQTLGGRLGQWTAADAVRSGSAVRATLLGQGQLPLPELMEMLREQGFRGPMVVDVRDLPDGIAGARHAAALLRRLLGGHQ